MALIVENGTGITTAEAYISVADADAYHLAMGATAWASATDAQKEVALRKASQFIDTRYDFRGEKLKIEQALEWPRDWWPNDFDEWPIKQLRQACCELALRALQGELVVDQEDRSVTEESVGPITVKYGDSRFSGQSRYVLVDRLMRKLTRTPAGRSLRVERS